MEETSRKNGAGQVLATTVYADGNDPYQPSSVTDGNGHTSYSSYDTYGNMTQATSARGTVTHNSFDYTNFALGELKATEQGGKTPTSFTYYEPSGLPKTISTPRPGTQGSGTVTTALTYDGLGNILTIIAPGNNATIVNGVDQGITTTFNYSLTRPSTIYRPRRLHSRLRSQTTWDTPPTCVTMPEAIRQSYRRMRK